MIKNNYENKTFSDIIKKEDVLNWNDNLILKGGTGTGKTHFILNTVAPLYELHSKKILFLCNRKSLSIQVKLDVVALGLNNVDVVTYQYIEYNLRNNSLPLKYLDDTYDLIVIDECHYFTLESTYNYYTDLSYEWLVSNDKIKVFMSATADSLFNHLLKNEIVKYENLYIINKSDKHVDEVYFYDNKKDVEYILDDIIVNSDDKVIYFTSSLEHGLELYEKYKDYSQFVCSEQSLSKKLKKIYTPIEDIINKGSFDKQLLITTSVSYNGLNFKDREIKHIITSIFEPEKVVQSLGRKRIIDELDTCTYYIRNYNKAELNLFMDNKSLNELRLLKSDYQRYVDTFGLDRLHKNNYIYPDIINGVYKLNNLAFINLENLEQCVNEMKKIGYSNYLIQELNISKDKVIYYKRLKEDKLKNEIEEYLESMVGKVMFSRNDRKELIETINVRDGRNNRLLKGLETLNGYLKEMSMDYVIQEFDTFDVVDGKKKRYRNAWKVVRLNG